MSSHTKEPWVLSSPAMQRNVRDEYETTFSLRVTAIDMPDQEHLAGVMVWGDTPAKSEETARRIVACVNACAGVTDKMFEGGWTATGHSNYCKRLNSQIANLQPQAEALHKVGHMLTLPAGTDVTVGPVEAVKNLVDLLDIAFIPPGPLAWRVREYRVAGEREATSTRLNHLDNAYQAVLAERDEWRTYAREAGAQKVQTQIELQEVKRQNKELLKALESMVQIARLTIGWSCTPANADGPLVVAEQLIARVKESA